MPQLLDRSRNRPVSRIDILSRMGETICLPAAEGASERIRPIRTPPKPRPPAIIDEEPERWDGLA